jgi:hypothetical protein
MATSRGEIYEEVYRYPRKAPFFKPGRRERMRCAFFSRGTTNRSSCPGNIKFVQYRRAGEARIGCELVGAAWVGKEVLSVPQLTSGQQGRCSDDSPDGLEPSCQMKASNQLASASSGLAIKDRNHFASCSSSITPEATASIVLTTGSSDAVISYPFRSRNVSATT